MRTSRTTPRRRRRDRTCRTSHRGVFTRVRSRTSCRSTTSRTALVRALAKQSLPLRAIARDSGVIATDDVVTPIGVYSDCGRVGDEPLEGEAVVTFTVFAEPDGAATRLQINSSMRTQAHRKGSSGSLKSKPVYSCASTGRFEANLIDTIRDAVKH